MRGLASDGGTYVAGIRGNADSGYGGNSSTHTDIAFSTRRGVAAMNDESVDNEMEDCSIILPIGLAGITAYYSHLAQIIAAGNPTISDSIHLTSQIFPVLGKYAFQDNAISTSTGFRNGADSLSLLNDASNTNSMHANATTRMLQNHIPVFL